ncbi:hypothetical protein ACJJTC_003094 [Scirpophaga incertulas]
MCENMELNSIQNEYFESYDNLEVHKLMLEDNPRTLAYRDAILRNRPFFNGKTVMDVGCGTGILSIFCAQAGVKKVYAVEASNIVILTKEIIKENNFEDIIEVIHSKVEDVVLPDNIKVDVIVSEWMGFYLLHEGMLDSVLIAREKFLKEGGDMFPESATIYASPCSVPTFHEKWDNFHGVAMSAFAKHMRVNKLNKPEIMTVEAKDILGREEIAVCWINLKEDTVSDVDSFTIEHVVGAKKDGLYQGLCLWFDCVFPDVINNNDNIRLDTGPLSAQTHWKQTVIVLPQSQEIEIGDPIAFKLELSRDSINKRRYNLQLSLLDPDEVEHPLPCTCDLAKYFQINEDASTSNQPQTSSVGTSTNSIGTHRKPFEELTPLVQKRRRVEELLKYNTESLAYATGINAKNKDVADIIKLITENPEEAITKIATMLKTKKSVPIYSAEKALGILTSCKLSKWQYTTLRSCAKGEGISLSPSYASVLEAKKHCYPPKDTIEVTKMGASIQLQALLDKTVERIGKFICLPSSLAGRVKTFV